MNTRVPNNKITIDYGEMLENFISLTTEKQKDNIYSIFLTGSFARGEATNKSDLDVWCIFNTIDDKVLDDVKCSIHQLPISYGELELNAQCLTLNEFNSNCFSHFVPKTIIFLEGVHLYGKVIVQKPISKQEVKQTFKGYLSEILLSIRHYISVDEPKENLTYNKIKTYILKPLMFSLRLERYYTCNKYPLTSIELLDSYTDSEVSILVNYFLNPKKLEEDINISHKQVLSTMHKIVSELIICGE